MIVKETNYFVVHGWQINTGLSGNELFIYAIIYGFSQDGESQFTGSLNYLASLTNSTKQTAIKCLKSLCEKGFLTKTDRILNGQNFPTYSANVFDFNRGKEILTPGKEILTGGIKETLPNNTINNNKVNIADERENFKYFQIPFTEWTKDHFKDSIQDAREKRKADKERPNFPVEMLTAFFSYWSEPDARGKMRFQSQKTWATANRLITWEQRDKK